MVCCLFRSEWLIQPAVRGVRVDFEWAWVSLELIRCAAGLAAALTLL